MRNYIVLSLFVFSVYSCKSPKKQMSQELIKIDSVFNFYFDVIEIEVGQNKYHIQYPEYYGFFISDKGDTLFYNKYIGGASSFMQKISGIEISPDSGDHQYFYKRKLDKEILSEWKTWYKNNMKNIKWNKDTKEPELIITQ